MQIKFTQLRNPGYEVRIEAGLLAQAGKLLKSKFPGMTPFVISSPRIWKLWGKSFETALRRAGYARPALHLVPDGEKHKNFKRYAAALKALSAFGQGQRTKPLVVLLGGGVIGDLGGFVAATYKRGLPFAQIPTTLLSMVDSSVGGKLGIDFHTPRGLVKNLVGVFHQPSLVLIDPKLLVTLPARDYRSGMAEVVKTAVIFDPGLFEALEGGASRLLGQDLKILEHVIAACVAHKASVVMKDEFDTSGSRALLNLGHTFGHAVEAASRFRLLHGEAVSFGMGCAVDLSAGLKLADPGLMRVVALLDRLGLPTRLPALPMRQVLEAMSEDKKFDAGMRFVVPLKIGRCVLKPVKDLRLVSRVLAGRFD